MKQCKKCGNELPNEYKKDTCEECIRKRNKKLKIGLGVAIGSALVVVSVVVLKSNKKDIQNYVNQLKKEETLNQITNTVVENKINNSKNYLTPLDKIKLEKAIEDGILPADVYKRAKAGIEFGHQTADEVIAPWAYNSNFLEQFSSWTEKIGEITDIEFQDAVIEAAQNTEGVGDLRITGNEIFFSVKSNSKRSKWFAVFNCADDNGNLSTNFSGSCPYPEAKVPRSFAKNILKELKYCVETKESN